MNTQNRHPRWWQLSLLVPLMMGLLLVDSHMRLFPWEHQVIEVGVVLLMYGALACWLWSNQDALEGETKQQGGWQRMQPAEWSAVEEAPWPTSSLPTASMPAGRRQDGDERYRLAEPVLFDAELKQTLHGPLNQCARPSGARLN